MSPFVLHVLVLLAFPQDTTRNAAAVQLLAMRGTDASLDAAVRGSPVVAHDALARLMTAAARSPAPAPALAASERVAESLMRQTGDSFPVRQIARFSSWSPGERGEKVALDSVRRAGNAAMNQRGFAAALPLWRESARRADALGDTAGIAAATGNIGAGWYGEGALDSAAAYFDRAAGLAQVAGDQRTVCNALGGLANVQRDRGNLAAARSLYEQTSRLRERIGDVRGLIADQNNSGILAERLGDLEGAQHAYEMAAERGQRAGLAESEAAGRVNLGQLAALRGDFTTAQQQYNSALAAYRRLGYRPDEALVLRSQGLMELRRGDYTQARALLNGALAIYRKTGPAAEHVAVLADLAAVSAATGHPEAARQNVVSAAAVADRAPDGALLQARVALARADLEADFNRSSVAERWYRRAELLFRTASDEPGVARARAGRGYLLLMDDDYAAAAALLDQAARTEEQLGDVRSAALTRLDLADAVAGADRPADAQALASTARDTLARLGDGPGEAAAVSVLARLALSNGRPAQAEALYREALAMLDAPGAIGTRWPIELGLAEALEAQSAPGAAKAMLNAAISRLEQSASDLTTDRRSAYFADKWELYSALARIEAADGRDSAAFAASERLRARELLEQLGRGRMAWHSGTDSALIRREQDLRRAITGLAGALDVPGSPGGVLRGPDAGASRAAEREALSEAEERYAALIEEVREREPGYAGTIRPQYVSWRRVAARLPADAALLEYLVADSAVLLFVVTPDEVRTLDLGVDRRTLAALVDFVRGALAQAPARGAPDAGLAALERLYSLLIEPAIATGLLEETRRLLIVPHGELHYLPYAALQEPGPRGRYLMERFDIALIPSASSWVEFEARPEARGRGVLAIAPAPVLLPGSLAEVNAIKAAYGMDADILTGAAASKSEVLRRAPEYGVLHIASYGVLNRRNPLFSYVELAPAGRADGRLEVHEVFGIGLNARLVVLSACQTAVGSGLIADVPAGDEWVSLSRAFLVAGARRVAASLWLVEDRATGDLMGTFHQRVAAGAAPSAALGAAQRAMLAQPGRSHPFYWAGFVVVGGF